MTSTNFFTRCSHCWLWIGLSGLFLGSAVAQEPTAAIVNSADKQTTRWQVGVIIEAIGGTCADLFATVPVPREWPEQQVRLIDQDVSRYVQDVTTRELDQGVQQLLLQIPRLPNRQKAHVLITLEIDRYPISAPTATDSLLIPSRPSRELKRFLAPSPYIETRDRKIRKLAKELVDPSLTAWAQIESFYDYVRDHVKYMNGPLKGAAAALRDGTGDCEELSSLFIALCRIHKVPARTVWVPDHCYAEFYLQDADGLGHWYPCQTAGTRAFGSIPELRPILQKGDNFKVPERKERQRYVAEFLTGSRRKGSGEPKVEFIRRRITDAMAPAS